MHVYTMATATVKQKNIERLIARCESILAGKTKFQGKEWKLPKYVSALDDQIRELEQFPSVEPDLLKSFRQRASVLHEVVRNETQPQALLECHVPPSPVHGPTPPVGTSLSAARGSELLLKAGAKRTASMREQLFAKSTPESQENEVSSLRHRSLEDVLGRHQQMQDEVADDMIRMARSLKHNSLLAKDIIISDTKALQKTSQVADQNIEGVENETERLKEHNRRCPWGIWLLLIVVFVIFIAMIVFIRIVPKPRYT